MSDRAWELHYRSIERGLREAARSYLSAGLRAYADADGELLTEGADLGKSANIISSICRGIEHLLKLRLAILSPALLVVDRSRFSDICDALGVQRIDQGNRPFRSVGFHEALQRVQNTDTEGNLSKQDARFLGALREARNAIEHFWRGFESLEVVKMAGLSIATHVFPTIERFIEHLLEESPSDYFDDALQERLRLIQRAIEDNKTAAFQRRLEKFRRIHADGAEIEAADHAPGEQRSRLIWEEIEVQCPGCGSQVMELGWEWVPDDEITASAVPKMLVCDTCHFWMDGLDVDDFVPEDWEPEPEDPDWWGEEL